MTDDLGTEGVFVGRGFCAGRANMDGCLLYGQRRKLRTTRIIYFVDAANTKLCKSLWKAGLFSHSPDLALCP